MEKMSENYLEGKVALVTGAGSGFGREMAITFASKGANLVLNDINLEGINETREIILKSHKVDILLAEADIANEEQVELMRKDKIRATSKTPENRRCFSFLRRISEES